MIIDSYLLFMLFISNYFLVFINSEAKIMKKNI